MIRVLAFGRMQDVLGFRETTVEAVPGLGLSGLRDKVFAEALSAGSVRAADILMSLNRVISAGDDALSDGDEVAFFSVFSGG